MIIAGIDPGLHGALAVLDTTALLKLTLACDLPTLQVNGKVQLVLPRLALALAACHIDQVFIEDVHAMPGQGVVSMFRFGHAAGAIEGLCAGLGLPVTKLQPRAWQKDVGLGTGHEDAARHRASQLYPADAYRFVRKKDRNVADAVLIATAGSLRLVGAAAA